MRRGDYQCTVTDKVASCAEDLGLACRVIRDLATVLQVPSESEEDDASNLGFEGGGKCLDTSIHDSSPLTVKRSAPLSSASSVDLPVPARHNLSAWAFCVSQVEHRSGGSNVRWTGILRQEVVCQSSIIWRAHSLATNDIRTECSLQV